MHAHISQNHAPPRLVSGWNFAEEVSVLNFVSDEFTVWNFARRFLLGIL
jgi:hypothetical protein